jgi:6-phosphogluconolactonase (cycloisomerase 2 family)
MQKTSSLGRLLAVVTAAAGLPALASAQPHTLYVESNVTGAGQNALFAYAIAADGSLSFKRGSPYLLGGAGYFDSSFALGPFDGDQSIIFNADRSLLYAVNGGSNTIAIMRVAADGSLTPLPGSPVSSHGRTPISLGLHGNTLVAADYALDRADPASDSNPRLSVFHLSSNGLPVWSAANEVRLPPASDPTQVLTTNTGPFVFTSGFPTGGILRSYAQLDNGFLFPADATAPTVDGAAVPILGLTANPKAPYLYGGLVANNLLATWRYDDLGRLTFVGTATDSGAALCWFRVTRNGRFLYASNTGDQSMSVFDLADPAHPVEIQHAVAAGVGGFNQFSLTPDEKYLYVLQEENSAASAGVSNKIYAYRVDPSTGLLTFLPDDTVSLPVPVRTRPIGLAIR